MQFLPAEAIERYPFIFRVDADVSFGSDLVESLLAQFACDPGLGIAGPLLLEPSSSGWHEVRARRFHAPSPARMYSRACFQTIGGLEPGPGWDTIDEMTALMRGFRTVAFEHLRAFHHRPQGAASGVWRNQMVQGYAAYLAGYSPIYITARAALGLFACPPLVAGLAMLAGYCKASLHRWPRLAPPELVRFVRRQQIRRLFLMESLWR